jgi:ubiquilin
MQAFADMQRATQVIAQEAPDLAAAMGIPRNLLPGTTTGGSTTTTNPNPTSNTAGARPNMGGLMDFLQQMNIGAASQNSGVPLAPPEERFRAQLEQLNGMGFTDNEANIRGLFILSL